MIKNIVILLFLILLPWITIKLIFGGGFGQELKERVFTLQDKKFSILVPKNLYEIKREKDNVQVKAFGNPGENINGVVIRYERLQKPLQQAKCSDLKRDFAFSITVSSLDKDFEICKRINPDYGESLEYSLDFVDNLDYYFVVVSGKEQFLDTTEDQEKAKKIFTSFSVKSY